MPKSILIQKKILWRINFVFSKLSLNAYFLRNYKMNLKITSFLKGCVYPNLVRRVWFLVCYYWDNIGQSLSILCECYFSFVCSKRSLVLKFLYLDPIKKNSHLRRSITDEPCGILKKMWERFLVENFILNMFLLRYFFKKKINEMQKMGF